MSIAVLYFGILFLYGALLFSALKYFSIPTYRSFIIFLGGIFCWILTLYIYFFIPTGSWLLFWGRINFAMALPVVAGITAFFYHFPKKTIPVPKTIEWISIIYATILFFITSFSPWIDAKEIMTNTGPQMTPGEAYILLPLSMGIYLSSALFIGLKKNSQLVGLNKIRFQYSFWVSLSSCVLACILNVILPMTGVFLFQEYSFLITVPIALSSFYAIQKYRFFHLSFLFLNILRTVFLFVFTIGTFFALWYFGKTFSTATYSESLHLFFSASIAILLFQWLEKRFPLFLPNEFRDFRNALTATSASLDQCTNFSSLQEKLEKTFVLHCNISEVKFILTTEKKESKSFFFLPQKEVPEDISAYRDGIVTAELQIQKKESLLLPFLQQIGAEVCFPLFSESHCIGLWFVGKKADQSLYSREEIDELNCFSRRLEVVCMNLLITSHLTKENSFMKEIIREKTKQLKKQHAKIKIFSQQQADFIAITAHEFRTPLTVALFQTEILLDEKKTGQHKEELQLVQDSLQNLKELTDQLFEVQQYDLQKISLEYSSVNFSLFLQEIYTNFSHLMKEKSIFFQLENHLPKTKRIFIDQIRMRQVFSNLLSNAIKFTPENGRITLFAEIKGNFLECIVANTSEKLSPQVKKRMFDKFFTKNGMGLGLGLHIVKSIVDLHQGTITLFEKKEEIRFHITLPVQPGEK